MSETARNLFWDTCLANGVVVVPFEAYSQYNEEGNLDERHRIGLRYVCLRTGYQACAGVLTEDFYLSLENGVTDLALVGETPDEALGLYLNKSTMTL